LVKIRALHMLKEEEKGNDDHICNRNKKPFELVECHAKYAM